MWIWIATHIFGIIGTLGGLGIVGLVVAVFAFGIPAMVIFVKIGDFFKEVVKFFQTPLGQAIGIILICIAVFFVADIRRTRLDAAEWDRRIAAAEAARVKRDADIKKKVQSDADKRIAAIESEKTLLEQRVADYEKATPNRPACRITADDLKRLQNR